MKRRLPPASEKDKEDRSEKRKKPSSIKVAEAPSNSLSKEEKKAIVPVPEVPSVTPAPEEAKFIKTAETGVAPVAKEPVLEASGSEI